MNDAGQVIGFSTISTEHNDPVGFIGFPTHTFIWQNGKKPDIGTLGGSDALPGAGCSHPPREVVAGGSTTSTTLNPYTNLPTLNPFLWHHGEMISALSVALLDPRSVRTIADKWSGCPVWQQLQAPVVKHY